MDLISRRAAIKAIDDLPNCYNGYSDTYDKACIIGVLEELPTIEPKPSPDWNGWETGCGRTYDVDMATLLAYESGKASAKPKKGKWIYHEPLDVFECSVCGRQMVRNIFDYCPWCGAKMERSEDG